MLSFIYLLSLLLLRVTSAFSSDTDNFKVMDTEELIKHFGYPLEVHNVLTEDDYYIQLYRIPFGKHQNKTSKPRPPVLLVHGMSNSAADWVLFNRSLGFALSDNGYDTWIMNSRGIIPKHKTLVLPRDSRRFFHFSWHEIGIYDVAASIDFMLNTTKFEQVSYIGFSQGGTDYLALMSVRPEYNKKVKLGILMAPGAVYKNLRSLFYRLSAFNVMMMEVIMNFFGVYQFPLYDVVRNFGVNLCDKNFMRPMCVLMFGLTAGFEDVEQLDGVDLRRILSVTPAPTALKQLFHYGQCINAGRFQWFDYGWTKNLAVYKSHIPPKYRLSAITSPVALYNGQNDGLVGPADVKLLEKKLSNVVYKYTVPYKKWNHADFMYGKDVWKYLYSDVIRLLNKTYLL